MFNNVNLLSQYSTGITESVEANDSYDIEGGKIALAMECAQTENLVFEQLLEQDAMEVLMGHNIAGITESQFVSVTEGVAANLWAKVVDTITSIWEKLKGILKTLRMKVESLFAKDNKAFWNKYSKDITAKVAATDYSDFKIKYAEPKSADFAGIVRFEQKVSGSEIWTKLKTYVKMEQGLGNLGDKGTNATKSSEMRVGASDYDKDSTKASDKIYDAKGDHKDAKLAKLLTDDEVKDLVEKAYGAVVGAGTCTSKEFAKEFDQHMFNDAEEHDGFSTTKLKVISDRLTSVDKVLKNIKSAEADTDKLFKEIKTLANKAKDATIKAIKNSGENTLRNQVASSNASNTLTLVSKLSTISTAYYGGLNAAIKKTVRQDRAIIMKAYAYNPKKSANEQSTLFDMIEESAAYDVEMAY